MIRDSMLIYTTRACRACAFSTQNPGVDGEWDGVAVALHALYSEDSGRTGGAFDAFSGADA